MHYTICVNSPGDWQEIHDLLCNDSSCSHIPDRQVSCTDEKNHSSTRGTFDLTDEEAKDLKNHEKIKWVELCPICNPDAYPKPDFATKRFKKNVKFYRDVLSAGIPATNPTSAELDRSNYGVARPTVRQTGTFFSDNSGTVAAQEGDVSFTLTGRNVDVIIHDSGVLQYHPEFMDANGQSRVRDIILDGPYYIDPDYFISNGYTTTRADGRVTGSEAESRAWWTNSSNRSAQFQSEGTISVSINYTEARSMGSSLDGTNSLTSGHGTACASLAAGKNFGNAFEANIWNMPGIGDNVSMGIETNYDAMKIWLRHRPVNSETGRKNPVVINGSWGYNAAFSSGDTVSYKFKGSTGTFIGNDAAVADTITALKEGIYGTSYFGTYRSWSSSSRSNSVDTAANEMMLEGVIYVAAAGNSNLYLGKGANDPHRLNYMSDVYFGTTDPRSEFPSGTVPCSHRDWMNPQGIGFDETKDFHPVVCVGALEDTLTTAGAEYQAAYSNNGPGIDVWAPADETLAAGTNGVSGYIDYERYDDDRFYDASFNGTSAASPVACGLIALFLEANPTADSRAVHNWLKDHGTTLLETTSSSSSGDGFWDQYTDTTNVNYWLGDYNLRGAEPRVTYNPYATDQKASMNAGVEQIIKEDLVMELDGEKEEIVDNVWRDTSPNGANNFATLDSGVDYYGDRYSYQFNGNAKASISNNSDFQSIGEFTIELWYNQHTHSVSDVYPTLIFGSWNGLEVDDNEFAIYQQPDGTLTYELAGGSANSGITSTHQTTPQLNTWNHVVLTRTGNKIDFYLNKEKTTYQGIYSPNITCTLETRVGTDNSTGNYLTRVTGISGGSGYETAPTVSVVNPGGATGAAFTVSLSTQGTFKRFEVTNGGSGYTYPPDVTLGGGMADVGATAAITAGVVTSISLDGIVYDTTNSGDIYSFGAGTTIANNGTGTGEFGGFDIGGTHLRFGDSDGGIRECVVNPVNATDFDTVRIYAIRGDDNNGGELPEGDSGDESLRLSYNIGAGVTDSWTDAGIIIWHQGLDGTYGNPGGDLRNWDISIPGAARTDNVYFRLYMPVNSGTIYDNYGILSVSFIDTDTEYTDSTVTLTPNALESNPAGITTATANVWINKSVTDIELTDGGSGYSGTYALSMSGGNPTSPGSGQAVADGKLYYDGYVGMVRYYKGRPFTQDEVNQHYEEQIARFDPSKKPSISFGNSDLSTDASLTGITTTGLVMHIDGPTGFDTDLSGNGNVPTYYSDNPYNGLSYLNYQGPITEVGSGGGLLSSVNITGGSFAIEAWIYLLGDANVGGYGQIVCQDDGIADGQGWQWRIGDGPYTQDMVYWTSSSRSSAVDLGSAPTSIPLNEWSHVAITYDGTDIRMYLNGVQDFIHTPAASLYGSSAQIGIGRFAGSTFASNYRLNARYGAVRLYDEFLTGDQIKSHYDLQKYRFRFQSLTLSYE